LSLLNVIGVNSDVMSIFSNVLIVLGCLPFTYLEINIGSNLKRTNFWKFIIDKINSRKGKCLHLLIGFV